MIQLPDFAKLDLQPEASNAEAKPDPAARLLEMMGIVAAKSSPVLYKGESVRIFSGQKLNAISDKVVDFGQYNAAHVEVLVNGTSPSATISLEGSTAEGGNYIPLPDPNASQSAVIADTSFDVVVGTRWVKARVASISGTFGSGQGFTVIITPFIAPGVSRVTDAGSAKTLKSADFSLSATGTVVAAVAGKRIKVYAVKLVCSAALSVNFRDGASTGLEGAQAFAANGGVAESVNPPAFLFGTTAGNTLDMVITGTGTVAGRVSYWDDDGA